MTGRPLVGRAPSRGGVSDGATPGSAASPEIEARPRRSAWRAAVGTAIVGAAGGLVLLPEGLSADARLALFGFVLATVLWVASPLGAAYVALLAAIVVTVPAGKQDVLFASLGDDVVWLVIGAFVLGGALQASGLARRFTDRLLAGTGTVSSLCWRMTAALVPLAFLVPSTSGRAAVLLPVHRELSDTVGRPRVTRALSLLLPSVILVSTTATLIGATSHLVAVDLLHSATGESISFGQWALWGVPFAVVASAATCAVVLRMFLTPQERRTPIAVPARSRERWTRDERVVGLVLAASLALWLTESLHGLEIATVTVMAALVLTAPRMGVMTWEEGLRHVSWTLVLFVAAALALGRALVDSGAATWVVDRLVSASHLASLDSAASLVVVLALLAVSAHLYMTSHTVRAVALVPPLLAAAAVLDLSPVAVVFLVSIGLDYCLTLPVSSKALLLFSEAGAGFRPADLLRLSTVMLPVYVVLMLACYLLWWQWTGLAL